MQVCKKCILNEKYPGIRFDDKGVCNFCNSHKPEDPERNTKKKYEKRFRDLIAEFRGRGIYDCLIAYSGGKDSSFTLHLTKTEYDLNILAVTFDNWFQSETAHQNVRSVIKNMNLDHLTVRPRFESFKGIMRACVYNKLYSMKALQRSSTICTTCLWLIRATCYKLAIEKEIPFVMFGLSPGQAPVATSVFKTNPKMLETMQNAIYHPLREIVGESVDSFFLQKRHFEEGGNFPYTINPLAFTHYDENEFIRVAESYGWRKPTDTDVNSTNCLLNAFANEVHIKQNGFHPYAFEIAGLVREGFLTREEGLKKMNEPPNPEVIAFVKKALDIHDI